MDHSRDGATRNTEGEGRSKRVKVLLADDHTMFREGLAGMLSSSYSNQVEVVGKTKIGQEAIKLTQQKNPDVIIMQVDRTLQIAKDTLKRMREGSSSSPKVIILTMFEEPQILREILDLEADAYLHKSASVQELLGALFRTTLDDEDEHVVVALPRAALEASSQAAWEKDGWGKDGKGRALTNREFEILLLAARGMNNRQIGSHLNLREATVKRHLANLYPKMEVGSRGEAVRKALENEWLTISEIGEAQDDV